MDWFDPTQCACAHDMSNWLIIVASVSLSQCEIDTGLNISIAPIIRRPANIKAVDYDLQNFCPGFLKWPNKAHLLSISISISPFMKIRKYHCRTCVGLAMGGDLAPSLGKEKSFANQIFEWPF